MVNIKCFKCNSLKIDSKPYLYRLYISSTYRSNFRREITTDRYQLIPLAACKKCRRVLTFTTKLHFFTNYNCLCVFFSILGGILLYLIINIVLGILLVTVGSLLLVLTIFSFYGYSNYSKFSPNRYVRIVGNSIYIKSANMIEWVYYNEFIADDFNPLVLDKTDKVQLRSIIISRAKQGDHIQELNLKGTVELVLDYFNLVYNRNSLFEYETLLFDLIQINARYFHNLLYPKVFKKQLKTFPKNDLLDMEKRIIENSFIVKEIGEKIIADFVGRLLVEHRKKVKMSIEGHIFFTNYRILCPFTKFKIKLSLKLTDPNFIIDLEEKILQKQKEEISSGFLKPFLNIPLTEVIEDIKVRNQIFTMRFNFHENFKVNIKISYVKQRATTRNETIRDVFSKIENLMLNRNSS